MEEMDAKEYNEHVQMLIDTLTRCTVGSGLLAEIGHDRNMLKLNQCLELVLLSITDEALLRNTHQVLTKVRSHHVGGSAETDLVVETLITPTNFN
jgi:hypothetical protein